MYTRLRSDTTGKLTVRKEPLNSGGYGKYSGQYFGTPNNVWEVEGEEGYGHVRAPDLAAAKRAAMREYPLANWGKKAVDNLVDGAAKHLAHAVQVVSELNEQLARGDEYPDQIRALLKHWTARIPLGEAALLSAQNVRRQNEQVRQYHSRSASHRR